jgi:hypothetical protein
MGGAYYDPSNGTFYVMEDTVDARGGFEVLLMRTHTITHLAITIFFLFSELMWFVLWKLLQFFSK